MRIVDGRTYGIVDPVHPRERRGARAAPLPAWLLSHGPDPREVALEGPEALVALEPPGSRFTLAQLYEGILTVPETDAVSAGT